MQNATAFVEELNKAFAAQPPSPIRPVFFVKSGPKFDKVFFKDSDRADQPGGSVFCFVNAAGEIFKAEGWSKPAKGARAHLSNITPEFCAKLASTGYATTGWLYR